MIDQGLKAWQVIRLSVLKYMDDNILHEKLCMDSLVVDENRMKVDENRMKRAMATRSSNLFK